jgi:hypothetical protein
MSHAGQSQYTLIYQLPNSNNSSWYTACMWHIVIAYTLPCQKSLDTSKYTWNSILQKM